MTAKCVDGFVKRPNIESIDVRAADEPLTLTNRAHVDLENGFVHVDDKILPIVCMLDEDNQETTEASKAVLLVAGLDNKGFVVVGL